MRKNDNKKKFNLVTYFISIIVCSVIIIFILNKFNIFNINEQINNKNAEISNNANTKDNTNKKDTIEKIKEIKKNVEEPKKNEEQENKQENMNNITVKLDLIGDEEVTIKVGDEYKDSGAVATDEKGNDVSKYITVQNEVDTSKTGDYAVIYSIGKSIVIRTVHVK